MKRTKAIQRKTIEEQYEQIRMLKAAEQAKIDDAADDDSSSDSNDDANDDQAETKNTKPEDEIEGMFEKE